MEENNERTELTGPSKGKREVKQMAQQEKF